MIELKNINKIFNKGKRNELIALNNINLQLPSKGIIFITGVSGSGKSTLLNIIGSIDTPTSGEILINNINISKLSSKKINNYRTNYVGFIFQEYNLLEDLNVFDNIKIALDLKNDKDKTKIYNTLNSVGLNNFEKRKIKDLSGGEKKRVTIARALIKNPSIILADEPTGNLDYENSKIILETLKEISKNRLVLVVSHNKGDALKYGDGLIELSDGKIVNKILKEENELVIENNSKNSHLSLTNLFKISFNMLKHKKIHLFLTCFLLTIALSFLGFSMSLLIFDIPKTHAEALIKENETEAILGKENYNNIYNFINDKDIKYLKDKINSPYIIANNLYIDNKESSLDMGSKGHDMSFYNLSLSKPNFLLYDSLNDFEIIGSIPEYPHEVLITQILAEHLTENGFTKYNSNNSVRPFNYEAEVETKEELLNQVIWIDNTYIIIKGIIKDNNIEKYYSLKEETQSKMNVEPSPLYEEYKNKYKGIINNIYIIENFFDEEFTPNYRLDSLFYNFKVNYNDKEYYDYINLNIIHKSVEYFDGNKFIKTNSLNNNEIIIDVSLVGELSNNTLKEEIDKSLDKAKKEYDKKVKQREELIATSDIEYIPEIEPVDYALVENNVIKKYINDNNIINSKINIHVFDKYNVSNTDNNDYEFIIKGVVFDEYSNSYISNDFKNYMLPNILPSYLKITEDNEQELIHLFNEFPTSNSKYILTTRFSEKINTMEEMVIKIESISKVITIILMIFSCLLLTTYIINNISVNKKKIGILVSLGTSSLDIIKIFIIESLIIGLISFIIASCFIVLSINLTNSYITKELLFHARPIIFNIKVLLHTFITILITLIISNIIPIIKISKTKPKNLID